MSFVPEDELKGRGGITLAPMIDFLFLMLVFFASLAISRVTTRDTDIDLVEIKPETKATVAQANASDYKVIHMSITSDNEYKWVTEIRDYKMKSAEEVGQELQHQYETGLLPQDPSKTHVMLKIDRKAQWEPILQLMFAIREAGFEAHPVYEPEARDTSLAETQGGKNASSSA